MKYCKINVMAFEWCDTVGSICVGACWYVFGICTLWNHSIFALSQKIHLSNDEKKHKQADCTVEIYIEIIALKIKWKQILIEMDFNHFHLNCNSSFGCD